MNARPCSRKSINGRNPHLTSRKKNSCIKIIIVLISRRFPHNPEKPVMTEQLFSSTSYWQNFSTSANLTFVNSFIKRTVPPVKILLGIVMFSVIAVSFTANLFVIISFIIEKKLRNSFTTLVVNLAVTDLLINVIAMDFYTINLIFEYWPFGKILCGVWVFFDYTTVFSSSWSLAAISIDRYWSIRWSVNYRSLKGYKKPLIMVTVVWYVCHVEQYIYIYIYIYIIFTLFMYIYIYYFVIILYYYYVTLFIIYFIDVFQLID